MNNHSARVSTEKIPFIHSLQFRLVAIIFALALIPLLSMMTYTLVQSRSMTRETTRSNFLVTAQTEGKSLSTWLEEKLNYISYLAELPQVQSFNQAEYKPVLDQAVKKMPSFGLIYVIGTDGKQVYKTDGTALADVSDRAYFTRGMKGEKLIGEQILSKTTGRLLIPVVAPITNQSGKVIGVLAGSLYLDSVSELLQSMQFGETGEAILFNENGYFLTASRFEAQLKKDGKIKDRSEMELQDQSAEAKKASDGESNSAIYSDYREKEAVSAFAPVKAGGVRWGILIKQDSQEVFKKVNLQTNIFIGLLIVASLLIIVLGSLYVRHLVRILNTVVFAGTALSLGDYNLTGLTAEERKALRERHDELGAVARSFTRMIFYQKNIAEAAQKIANGDLTAVIEPVGPNDMSGQALKKMIISLHALVENVQQNALSVQNASQSLSSAVEQAGQATNQVSITIQQVASGIGQQAESVNKTATSTEQMAQAIASVAGGAAEQSAAVSAAANLTTQLSRMIQEVSNQSKEQAGGAAQTVEASKTSVQNVENSVKGMQTIKAKVDFSSSKVEEMGKRSEEIGNILETIDDIASQTNMLALNAAIEAARAGEHGKGFAVVADEVRKLAEKSATATKEIGKLIRDIQKTVSEAIQAMNESALEVERGVEQANLSRQSFDVILQFAQQGQQIGQNVNRAADKMSSLASDLVNSMDSVSAVVEKNTASTEQMSANANEVTQAVESIASVSEENSAAVEEVSASAEEINAQVEEISSSAQSLANMAKDLTDVVSQFKLS